MKCCDYINRVISLNNKGIRSYIYVFTLCSCTFYCLLCPLTTLCTLIDLRCMSLACKQVGSYSIEVLRHSISFDDLTRHLRRVGDEYNTVIILCLSGIPCHEALLLKDCTSWACLICIYVHM